MNHLPKLALALLAATAAAATAAPLPKSGTFFFFDACASPGGDYSGYAVTLTRKADAVSAMVEFNDSGPDGKAKAKAVRFDPAGGKLSFSFQGDLAHNFQGSVSAEKLVGVIDGRKISLPALRQKPKHLPPCDPRFPP
jgi:hypothetical protein